MILFLNIKMETKTLSLLMNHGVKRDHENGICPVTCNEFVYPDSEDFICWSQLVCSECGEIIGARACELRNNFTCNCDEKHKLGLCPKTNKQFTLPMTKITCDFICSECNNVIDWCYPCC